MADDDLQFRESVENSVRDHPNALGQHLLVPAISRPTENVGLELLRVFRPCGVVKDLEDLVSWIAGMQVDRYIESNSTCQHRREIGMIEILLRDMSVGQRTQEAIFSNRAFQFVRRRLRALQGQGGESLEAARIFGDRPAYQVPVKAIGKVDTPLPGDILYGRCMSREDLNVESPRVHIADAALAQIRKTNLLKERNVILIDGVQLQQRGSRKCLLRADEGQVLVSRVNVRRLGRSRFRSLTWSLVPVRRRNSGIRRQAGTNANCCGSG